MTDTTLSPRLRHLLIQEDRSTGKLILPDRSPSLAGTEPLRRPSAASSTSFGARRPSGPPGTGGSKLSVSPPVRTPTFAFIPPPMDRNGALSVLSEAATSHMARVSSGSGGGDVKPASYDSMSMGMKRRPSPIQLPPLHHPAADGRRRGSLMALLHGARSPASSPGSRDGDGGDVEMREDTERGDVRTNDDRRRAETRGDRDMEVDREDRVTVSSRRTDSPPLRHFLSPGLSPHLATAPLAPTGQSGWPHPHGHPGMVRRHSAQNPYEHHGHGLGHGHHMHAGHPHPYRSSTSMAVPYSPSGMMMNMSPMGMSMGMSMSMGMGMGMGMRAPISRTTKACNACRSRKVRCDAGGGMGAANGGMPGTCSRCKESGVECVYSGPQKKRGPCPGTARPSIARQPRRASSHRQSVTSPTYLLTPTDDVPPLPPLPAQYSSRSSYGFPSPVTPHYAGPLTPSSSSSTANTMYDPLSKSYGGEWRRPSSSSEYPPPPHIPRQASGQWTSIHPAHASSAGPAHERPGPYARQPYDNRRPSYASHAPPPDWPSSSSARPPAPPASAGPYAPHDARSPVFRPDYSMRVDERRPSASGASNAPHEDKPSLPPLVAPGRPPTSGQTSLPSPIPIPGAAAPREREQAGRGSMSGPSAAAAAGGPGEGSLFGGEGRSLPPLKVAIGRRPSYYTP